MEDESKLTDSGETKEAPFSDDCSRIYGLIYENRDALIKVVDNELLRYGISATESQAIYIIFNYKEDDMITPAELARRMFREPSSVKALLERMEKKGIISKAKDQTRKNIRRISLTEKGKGLYQMAIKMRSIKKVMSNLDENERRTLINLLIGIREEAFKQLAYDSSQSFLESKGLIDRP